MSSSFSFSFRPRWILTNHWSPIEIDFSDISYDSNFLSNIISGECAAVVIKNFYDADSCKKIVNRIEKNFLNDDKITKKIGVSLLSYMTRKSDYFLQADKVRPSLRAIFKNLEDPRKKIHFLLSELFPKKEIAIATEDGKKYACGVIRIHEINDYAPIHRDCVNYEAPNFFVAKFPNQLSTVLYLQQSEKGGDLLIHKKKWKKHDEKFREITFGYSKKVIKNCTKSCVIKPNQGDLVILNPIYYHEILPVKGSSKRVSLGLFLAFSKFSEKIVTWS